MSKLSEQLDAQNIAENKRHWKRNAAEEMYEALKSAYHVMTGNNDPFDQDIWVSAVNQVFAAILKAEGRQP